MARLDRRTYYSHATDGQGRSARVMAGMGDRPRPTVDRVLVVGVGDDGPAGLPPAILARIGQAELLVGGRRHLDHFAEHPAERLTIASDLTPVLDRVRAEAERRRVV